MDFVLVTGNPGKLEEARRICGFEVEAVDAELPEIQSLDLIEVLRHKAEEAWRLVRRPLVVEETGFGLTALGGFPGPLVKWMLDAVGPEGIARVGLALEDPGAVASCGILYTNGVREVIGIGETHGTLTLPPRGEGGFGWDPIFVPDGESRTYGELPPEDKDAISHRGRAWMDLLSQLAS